jgi:hypothetical protein
MHCSFDILHLWRQHMCGNRSWHTYAMRPVMPLEPGVTLPNSTSCWGKGEESYCSCSCYCSWRGRSRSSCRRQCSRSRWLDWHGTVRRRGRSTRREGKKGIIDLRAVHLIRAIYKRHRNRKSESRTIRPASKQKDKWDKFCEISNNIELVKMTNFWNDTKDQGKSRGL